MARSGQEQEAESTAAFKVLKRAMELDSESRYQQALVCYQEGIDLLMQVLRGEQGAVERIPEERNWIRSFWGVKVKNPSCTPPGSSHKQKADILQDKWTVFF
uniref:MIT domain-containing protein n=1 Tax=Felis catus TaxID=9685 RepID=A0ABI7W272_FELCA